MAIFQQITLMHLHLQNVATLSHLQNVAILSLEMLSSVNSSHYLHVDISGDSRILLANDKEFCVFHAKFRNGYYNVVWTCPFQVIVPAMLQSKNTGVHVACF